MKSIKYTFIFIILVCLFFATSTKIYYKEERNKNVQKMLKTIPYKIKITEIQKIYAANEDKWDGVRAAITFVKDVTNSLDTLFLTFKKAGIFNLTGTYINNDGTYKIKLVMNEPQTISLTAGGTKEFSNRLILWNASTNQKYLELYFDDPDNKTGDGAVITWEPGIMNPTLYNTGKRMECYTDISNKTMICSWEGPINKINEIAEKAQIIAKETTDNKITINALIKTNTTTSNNIQSSLGVCDESGTRYFYTLIAVIKNVSPYYTTAAFGAREDQKSLNLGSCTNFFNYGYFNTNVNPDATDSTKYFARMGNTPPSSDYPSTSEVSTLLSLEPNVVTVNAITVNFKSSDAAP
jgi:hypothetical protein